MTYNAEIRGFLGYYSLADNLKDAAGGVLWMTRQASSAHWQESANAPSNKSQKPQKGPNRYVVTLEQAGKE